jgi:hypothetical protein
LTDSYFACSGTQVGSNTAGRGQNTVFFDEMGLINTATTKLFEKWMGEAIDAPQEAPRVSHATGEIWWREFDNALVIVNTDNDSTNSAALVTTATLPGGADEWMTFNGSQDSAVNDNSALGATLSINPVDGIILVRKSWYNAL